MNDAVTVQPFPWDLLEATSRAEVGALAETRRWLAHHVHLDAFGRALTELVGRDVQVRQAAASRGPRAAARSFEGAIHVVLAPGDDDASEAALEVEPELAAALLALVLKRPPVRAVNVSVPPSAALAGALAAVLVAAARRAYAGGASLRVLSAGPPPPVQSAGRFDFETLALSLGVLVGGEAFSARLVLHMRRPFTTVQPQWTARRLASLGQTPLSIPIVACATAARVADVASLRVGDAWLPGGWRLEAVPEGATGAWSLRGRVLLAAPSAASGVRAQLVESGRLVLSGEADAVDGEAEMTDPERDETVVDAVGDVPVIVRVEIGEARMAARDWASLERGDVITVGRRVGELVLLRVGGVPVARGELVNVDGEVGVRIAERLAGETTPG
jgi:flagellar motor switch/type III secretory pathway protein FliN